MLPLSFRLIIFDTALLVKKSLTILIQNGEFRSAAPAACKDPAIDGWLTFSRHCVGAAVGLEELDLCRAADYIRLHQLDTVLLAESRSHHTSGSVQAEQSKR